MPVLLKRLQRGFHNNRCVDINDHISSVEFTSNDENVGLAIEFTISNNPIDVRASSRSSDIKLLIKKYTERLCSMNRYKTSAETCTN